MLDRQWFILYVVVCLEVGLFLLLVPWSTVWERNYFLQAYPSLRPLLLSPAMRGAVAGLGLANIYLAVNEVLDRRRTVLRDGELLSDGPEMPGKAGENDATSASASAPAEAGRMAADERR
jgi:hypothetical protein